MWDDIYVSFGIYGIWDGVLPVDANWHALTFQALSIDMGFSI